MHTGFLMRSVGMIQANAPEQLQLLGILLAQVRRRCSLLACGVDGAHDLLKAGAQLSAELLVLAIEAVLQPAGLAHDMGEAA